MMKRTLVGALAGLILVSTGSMANDTSAELAAGGLQFVRSDIVEMVREDLYLSTEEVRVDYVFRNRTEHDLETIVAFPMPDILYYQDYEVSIPHWDSENFMGFSVTVDGQSIEPRLQQRALVSGVDMTRQLLKRDISPLNYQLGPDDALSALPREDLRELERLGLVAVYDYISGSGEARYYAEPTWTLSSVYYWSMEFPAGQDVRVSHRYTPSVGVTTGFAFDPYKPITSEWTQEWVEDYCLDENVLAGIRNRLDNDIELYQSWMTYILTTGGNWSGPIGTFHLTVDKGSTDNLVTWCGSGIEKTGPTTFEVTIEDYWPEEDLDILFFRTFGNY